MVARRWATTSAVVPSIRCQSASWTRDSDSESKLDVALHIIAGGFHSFLENFPGGLRGLDVAPLVTAGGYLIADRQCRTADDVAEFVSSGCDVLLTFRIPPDITQRAPGLRWIQLLSAGADHVLGGGALKGCSIPLTTASGIHATPIAEYTLASMLAYAHRIHLSLRAQIRSTKTICSRSSTRRARPGRRRPA